VEEGGENSYTESPDTCSSFCEKMGEDEDILEKLGRDNRLCCQYGYIAADDHDDGELHCILTSGFH